MCSRIFKKIEIFAKKTKLGKNSKLTKMNITDHKKAFIELKAKYEGQGYSNGYFFLA